MFSGLFIASRAERWIDAARRFDQHVLRKKNIALPSLDRQLERSVSECKPQEPRARALRCLLKTWKMFRYIGVRVTLGGLGKEGQYYASRPAEGWEVRGLGASLSFIYLGDPRRARENRSTHTPSRDRARSPNT